MRSVAYGFVREVASLAAALPLDGHGVRGELSRGAGVHLLHILTLLKPIYHLRTPRTDKYRHVRLSFT